MPAALLPHRKRHGVRSTWPNNAAKKGSDANSEREVIKGSTIRSRVETVRCERGKDIGDRGAFDPIDHLRRELREETGIRIDELDAEPGWILVRDRCSVSLIKWLRSRQNADDLRHRIIRHIRAEQQPELSDMRIVRGPAQLDARMPKFVRAFLQEQWRQETATTC
jgi:hypothetical protein